ncbi:hypothetical protein GQ53DRAFT_416583 [Thozetella sp. PMI_491]|nr:hypothetical protein GQ53DRAFT_416583 [Thozetella sp. PMI_491]
MQHSGFHPDSALGLQRKSSSHVVLGRLQAPRTAQEWDDKSLGYCFDCTFPSPPTLLLLLCLYLTTTFCRSSSTYVRTTASRQATRHAGRRLVINLVGSRSYPCKCVNKKRPCNIMWAPSPSS